jgi:hypothetical protein
MTIPTKTSPHQRKRDRINEWVAWAAIWPSIGSYQDSFNNSTRVFHSRGKRVTSHPILLDREEQGNSREKEGRVTWIRSLFLLTLVFFSSLVLTTGFPVDRMG